MHLLWISPLALLIFFLASPRFRGDIAETRVRRILANGLEKNRYTVLDDLVLPSGGGSVRLDHVVVSKFGIFVIESQYARGYVSGTEFQDRWKQYHFRRFTRFDNPMHRNSLQREALVNLLKLPRTNVHPIVVMVGQKGFKTGMPENVLEPEKLIRYMRKKAEHVLDSDQVIKALQMIETARIRPAREVPVSKWGLVRFLLLLALLGGVYLAFRNDITGIWNELAERREQQSSPELFHSDGSQKTEQELWEDSLICAYSADSARCACYEPDGSRVELEASKCQSLAERGSILKQ